MKMKVLEGNRARYVGFLAAVRPLNYDNQRRKDFWSSRFRTASIPEQQAVLAGLTDQTLVDTHQGSFCGRVVRCVISMSLLASAKSISRSVGCRIYSLNGF